MCVLSRSIDLNVDAGESFGRWKLVDEDKLFPYVTSVNIACGFHAGDPLNIWKTVKTAKKHGNAIGAHPGFPDLIGFGRRPIEVDVTELKAYIIYQLGALNAFLRVEGLAMQHVKPHGALYNMAWVRDDYAEAIVEAIIEYDKNLILVAPYKSRMAVKAEEHGLKVGFEAFIDRAYTREGRLVPRSKPGAVIRDVDKAVEQALMIIDKGIVKTIDGSEVDVRAHTLCIHGDTPNAVEFVRTINYRLRELGVEIKPLGEILH